MRDEVVERVEREVVDQVVLGLAALLLRADAAVLRAVALPAADTGSQPQ